MELQMDHHSYNDHIHSASIQGSKKNFGLMVGSLEDNNVFQYHSGLNVWTHK